MTTRPTTNSRSTPSSTEFWQKGQDAYNEKRYEDALEAFNKAVAASKAQPAILIQVLDHLVGVHVKLKQLDDALMNAKSMIRCIRSDARGYLRCGQVQRLQENQEDACKWYEHGLKNVDVSDRLRPALASSLEKVKDQAARKRVQSKPCDPTTTLPLEVARMVFGHLDYKEHVGLLRVSKSWRRLLSSLPPITDTIDFTGAGKTVSRKMFSAAVRRLSNYPTTVMLTSLSEPAIQYLNDRLGLWCNKSTMKYIGIDDNRINLKAIRWQDLPLRSLELGSDVPLRISDLEQILLHCHNLGTLVAQMSSIDGDYLLDFEPEFVQKHMEKLVLSTNMYFKTLACFPNLAHFSYRRMNMFPTTEDLDLSLNAKLRYVEISAVGMSTLLPKGIETLKNWNTSGFCFFLHRWSNIRHLELRCWPISLGALIPMLKIGVLDQVQKFAIEFCHDHGSFDQTELDVFFTQCFRHEHLRLKTSLLGDADFGKLVGTTPKLRSLIIEDAQITGAFLADLFKSESCRIESIGLRGCTKVSSDTWDWIRQRGVFVDVRNASERHDLHGARRLVDLR